MLRTTCLLGLCSSLALASPAPPIVGGSPVPPGAWPDVVAVIGDAGMCTGTLIAPDVVLTAGHCIELDPVEVITRTVDYGMPYPGEHIRVKWSRAYPSWFDRYDVGVLMLERVAGPTPRQIASACLANARLAEQVPVQIVGFGLTSPDATDENTALYQATAPVLDPFCEHAPGCAPAAAPNGEFTAGGRGTDSCFGDSGGPALIDTPSGPALVGVVSRGLALPGAPCGNGGIYVRADKVVAWIQAVTGRKLSRTTCDGRGDEPDEAASEPGGCSAGGGPGSLAGSSGLGLMVALLVGRRQRRR